MQKKKKTNIKKIYIGGVPKKSILFFTKNLSIMLKTGSTLNEALTVIKKLSKGKLQSILDEITSKVEKGINFSEALKAYPKVFSQIYINIVKIGEESGTLDKNLQYLSEQLEKSHKLKKQMIGAMIYPMIILGGTFILGTVLSIFVLPKLTRMFKNFKVELPITTQILIKFSDFMDNYGLYFFFGMIALFIFLYWFVRLKKIKPITHLLLLKIPVVKVFSKNYNLSMFYRSLSVLLISGTTIDDALVICSKTVNNVTYQNFILHLHKKIKGGENLYDLLLKSPKLFPPTDTQIINVGEESGTLSDSLAYTASIREEELNDLTKNLSTILEPLLFIFLGVIVAILALSIIAPIYSITQQFDA